jgi:hypothetical protein
MGCSPFMGETLSVGIFLYLFCFDFRKINGRIKKKLINIYLASRPTAAGVLCRRGA